MWTTFRKPQIWIPISLGLIIAGVLAAVGENDEAPWLMLIGFLSAIFLLFFGFYNIAAVSKRSLLVGILLILLACLGIVHAIGFWFTGENQDSPGAGGLIILISIGFAIVGARFVKKTK